MIDVGDPADYTADLDPADFEEKSYVAGIGVIKEEKVQGGDEVVELIEYVPAG